MEQTADTNAIASYSLHGEVVIVMDFGGRESIADPASWEKARFEVKITVL